MKSLTASILLLIGPLFSCAIGVSLSTTAGVDSQAKGLIESRLEGTAAVGNPRFQLRSILSAGGGYDGAGSAGYLVVMPGVGLELTGLGRLITDVFYVGRFFPDDDQDSEHSVGLTLTRLWKIVDLGAEDSALYLGPRLQAETDLVRGRFMLGLCLTWITYDTMRGNWGM